MTTAPPLWKKQPLVLNALETCFKADQQKAVEPNSTDMSTVQSENTICLSAFTGLNAD